MTFDDADLLLEPDNFAAILPAGLPKSGGVRLAQGILAQALLDLRGGHGAGCVGHPELVTVCEHLGPLSASRRPLPVRRVHALAWLVGFCELSWCRRDHSGEWPFAFIGVASALRLDPEQLRGALLKWDLQGCGRTRTERHGND